MIVPAGIDDPRHPSGGNVYDRRVCRGLAAMGWSVHEHQVRTPWPWSDPTAGARLCDILDAIPAGQLVLVDGLVASSAPAVVVPRARKLGVVVLVHMPAGASRPDARGPEQLALASATAVVATSRWARQWLLDHYDLDARQIHVAEPGVEITSLSSGSAAGSRLLCVGAVTRLKGHDVLVEALAELVDLPWTCQVAGPLDVDTSFVEELRRRVHRAGLGERLRLVGPLGGMDLAVAYDRADVLVVASRVETYGMVVTEAIGHGVPVIAASVGGVPEALGCTADGRLPGLLVRPAEAGALAAAIRAFLSDASLRRRLRLAATDRRAGLQPWSSTSERLAHILSEILRGAAGEPEGLEDRNGLQSVSPPPATEGARG
jgi:glycosyltransferase involved in cell wall biosynthesis